MTLDEETLAHELAALIVPALREQLRRDLADVLDVADVMSRYGLSDRRAARAAMRAAGGTFTVARRLLIHRATLEAWERSRAGEACETPAGREPTARRSRRARGVLPPEFWQAGE